MELRFEQQLEAKLGWANVSTTSSCTIGLQLLIRALELDGEVIVPAFSHPATYQALHWNGVVPVPVDVEEDSLTINAEAVSGAVSSRTTAILAVHLFGHPANIADLEFIARKHGLALLADAAAATSVLYQGLPLTAFGDAAVFSFHATKILGTGEGGAVSCADPIVASRIRRLRNFGLSEDEAAPTLGTNGKFNEIQAALGLAALELLPNEIAARKEAVLRYREKLSGINGLSIICPRPETTSNHAYLAIRARTASGEPAADYIMQYLDAHHIDSRRYFGAHYRMILPSGFPTPVAEAAAHDSLCLPLWGGMPPSLIDYISGLVREGLSMVVAS